MTKLRVIEGGKSADQTLSTPVKLFSAYSLIDGFKGHDCVRFNWIYLNRQLAVAPYEKLVSNFKGLNKNVRPYFEECVKEFFTLDEINLLKSYLLSRGTILYVKEEVLPITDVFIPISYRQMSPREGRGFYDLSAEEDYAIPFKVWGYFDLRTSPLSMDLPKDSKERGVLYVKEAIQSLLSQPDVDQSKLESLVESLYDNYGLHVQRGQTREERLKAREPVKNE